MDASSLFAYDLTPSEFMAACFMLACSREGVVRVRTSEIEQVLKCSRATAKRVIAGLVDKGLFARPAPGVFIINQTVDGSPMSQKGSPVSHDGSPMSQEQYVYVADYGYRTNGSTTDLLRKSVGVQAPLKGDIELRYDYENEGSDLLGIGAIDRPEPKRKRPRRDEIKYHRTVPREEWDMVLAAKEFSHRLATLRPDLAMDNDKRVFGQVLGRWENDYGVTPQEIADAIDRFWENPEKVRSEPAPWRQFLQFAKVKTNRSDSGWTEEELAALDEEYHRG